MTIKLTTALFAALSLGLAQAPPTKIGIIHIQSAIISTREGQKAAQELQNKFDPRRKSLEAKQSEIAGLQQKLAQGANTMAEQARIQLTRDIDQKTKEFNRSTEDAQAEFEQERNKMLNELGGRLVAVINKYAQDHSYALILDVSSPETPVLYAATGTDITKDIIDLYDKNAPSALPAAPAPKPAGGATGAASPAAAPKPAAAAPKTPAAK